jgi:citrate lyase beta subunit
LLSVQLPAELDAGPDADVSVTLNARTSTPVVFSVTPWLSAVTPIRTALDPARGNADLKVSLQGSGFTATPQAVRFEGPGGTTTVTAFDAGGSDALATVTTPAALENGVYRVRIVLADSSASNSRSFEVMPLVNSPIGVAVVTVSAASVHRLTLQGARLNGNDVRLTLDGVSYLVGANTTPGEVVYTLGRLLAAGSHRVAVTVDASTSRGVDFVV